MRGSGGLAFICHGFNNYFDLPKAIGGRRMTLRTAVVIKKRDFFDEWDVYDDLFWRMTERVSAEISDRICIKTLDVTAPTFDSLPELRAWQSQQKLSDSEFVIEPPGEIWFYSRGDLVCRMMFENWSDIVKHEPYACSFTFSFYSDNLKINFRIGEILQAFLSAAPEISNATTVQEAPSPKWYWPLMDRLKSDKFFIYGMFSLMAVAAAAMIIFRSQSLSTSNKIDQCRRFLQQVRYVLLAVDENATDKAFIDWRDTRNITQTNGPLVAQICEYCKKYSEQSGKPVRTHVIDGVEHLVDPWGNPYNADMLYRFHDEGIRKSLRDYTVGGIVLWSSGPNGINENGGGDDIFELSRKTWCQRRGAADE